MLGKLEADPRAGDDAVDAALQPALLRLAGEMGQGDVAEFVSDDPGDLVVRARLDEQSERNDDHSVGLGDWTVIGLSDDPH